MKRLALLVASVFSGLSLLLVPVAAHAVFDPIPQCNTNSGVAKDSPACNSASREPTSEILKIANIIAIITGVAAVIMIIIAGIQYTMSSGESNAVNQAKNTIIYTAVGLAVVLLARIIVQFVVNAF
jgi:zinc transporter ZupT